MMARYIRATVMADTSPMVLGTKKVENRCINIHFYLIISEAFYHVFISCSSVWLKKKNIWKSLDIAKAQVLTLSQGSLENCWKKKISWWNVSDWTFTKRALLKIEFVFSDLSLYLFQFSIVMPNIDTPRKKKKIFPGFQILNKWLISQGFTVGAERPSVDFSQLYHWEVG